MNDQQNRRYQMFIRVRGFMTARIGDFSPAGKALEYFNQLKDKISDLDGHAASQASGINIARQGTNTRGEARLALRQSLEAINRAARAMGLADKFPVPPQGNDRNLIQAGRAAALNALPLRPEFVAHEMPNDFIDELTADIVDLEDAIAGQDGAVESHVHAGAAIDETIEDGVELVRKLDGLVRNKYVNDPALLAEWLTASHTERAPRRQPPAPPPPPPNQPTA